MGKQSIYVKHKDEIFEKYKDHVNNMLMHQACPDDEKLEPHWLTKNSNDFGYKKALEWVLNVHKTQEQKDQEFSDKIDELTSKGESNEHQD